jgi:response regulator of citrate/malate metabolism
MEPLEQINETIERLQSERDRLDSALAHVQEARQALLGFEEMEIRTVPAARKTRKPGGGRTTSSKIPEMIVKAIEDNGSPMSVSEIAKAAGVSRASVDQAIRRCPSLLILVSGSKKSPHNPPMYVLANGFPASTEPEPVSANGDVSQQTEQSS